MSEPVWTEEHPRVRGYYLRKGKFTGDVCLTLVDNHEVDSELGWWEGAEFCADFYDYKWSGPITSITESLTWTIEPPTVPGWYWERHRKRSLRMYHHTSISPPVQRYSDLTEWAGPIPEPQEPPPPLST